MSLIYVWRFRRIDMLPLSFRYFAHVMFFTGAEKDYRNNTNKRDAFPKAKSHNAEGE
jgi:hypothetical protein